MHCWFMHACVQVMDSDAMDSDAIAQLQAMGFSENACARALRRARDVQNALEWLLVHSGDPGIDGDQSGGDGPDVDDFQEEEEANDDATPGATCFKFLRTALSLLQCTRLLVISLSSGTQPTGHLLSSICLHT